MKIIKTDNFCRENKSDTLIATGLDKHHAEKITQLLNKETNDDSPDYYKAVEDNHQLYTYEP